MATPHATPHAIAHWNAEDPAFWHREGHDVAARNLWLSVPALMLAFAVWMLWPTVVVQLPAAGFRFSTNQLYWLAALPALSGATLRIVYAFAVPAFGGRRVTALATASLLLPTLGLGLAVQDPTTPYEAMVALALLAGLGGANFASSMAHISLLYPRGQVGWALGVNAGLGNLGVSLAQAVVPLVTGVALFGSLGGAPQPGAAGTPLWLQNAGFVWVPLIVASAVACWIGMTDLADVGSGFAEQAVVFRRKHNWLLSWLYLGTFGSFIGWAAAFPLLLASRFPDADLALWPWLGPLLGALLRPLGGALADRLGGARVTLLAFVAMTLGTGLAWRGLLGTDAGPLPVFLLGCMVLFAAAGIGSSSVFKMIPAAYAVVHRQAAPSRGEPHETAEAAQARARSEAAATLGFASAVGAYGGFVIPKSLGTAAAVAAGPAPALGLFAVFYLSCIAVTWWYYGRRRAPFPC